MKLKFTLYARILVVKVNKFISSNKNMAGLKVRIS